MCGAGGGAEGRCVGQEGLGWMCGAGGVGVDVWGSTGGLWGGSPTDPPPLQHMAAVRRLQAEVEAALKMEGERKEWGEGLQCDPQVRPRSGTHK